MDDNPILRMSRSWWRFRKGKRRSVALDHFEYGLEEELWRLHTELSSRTYRHGPYRQFIVHDNKRRTVSVASIRDRVVHRLLYDYMLPVFDPLFSFNVWSCRPGKGLLAGIEQTQRLLRRHPNHWVWRTDVAKFFDCVDHEVLRSLLARHITDKYARWLLDGVIGSYQKNGVENLRSAGIPIGNLTSQIFANIYLHEFDQFVDQKLCPTGYVRYGDDFIVLERKRETLEAMRQKATEFLANRLRLTVHKRSNVVIKPRWGLHYLGVRLFPNGRTLNRRMVSRMVRRLAPENLGSYHGLNRHHGSRKALKRFDWQIMEMQSDLPLA